MKLLKSPTGRASSTSARSRFGRFKDEKVQPVRDPIKEDTPGFRSIMEAWMKIINFPYSKRLLYENQRYYINAALQGREYTSEDVTSFSIALAEFENEPHFKTAASFIRLLLKHSSETDFLLCTAGLTNIPRDLGWMNNKNIEIAGDGGFWLGRDMFAGNIFVRGNADDQLGDHMSGGLIVVEGDAGNLAGAGLEGGAIIIKGNAGHNAGRSMVRGRVEIFGDAGDEVGSRMKGGLIAIHKNAGDWVGYSMEGGKIFIHGDVGDYLGGYEENLAIPSKRGPPRIVNIGISDKVLETAGIAEVENVPEPIGEIIVMGNAGEHVGENMKGGTIWLYGSYKSLGKNIGGKIYHMDKLIYGKDV